MTVQYRHGPMNGKRTCELVCDWCGYIYKCHQNWSAKRIREYVRTRGPNKDGNRVPGGRIWPLVASGKKEYYEAEAATDLCRADCVARHKKDQEAKKRAATS